METCPWKLGLVLWPGKLAESLPQRWAHVQGVARQARTLRAVVGRDSELLEAAAILHKAAGYAPDLAVTGFHPLDARGVPVES